MGGKSDDKILLQLQVEQLVLQVKIRDRRRELGKQQGVIFDSIDELVCDMHQGAHFRIIGQIPGGINYMTAKQLNLYVCEVCKPEDRPADLKFTGLKAISKAYDCPSCGIVKGELLVRPYSSPPEAWAQLAGREGSHFHCSVCDDMLGYDYWKVS